MLLCCATWATSTLSTKVAGSCWLLLVLLSIPQWKYTFSASNNGLANVARIWWYVTSGTLVLWASLDLWHVSGIRLWQITSQTNSILRLSFLALATVSLCHPATQKWIRPLSWKICTAVAAFLGLVLVIVVDGRDTLPSNAIPWAAAMAMLACLLLPWATSPTPHLTKWQRRGLATAACAAMTGVMFSQSRGIFGIWLWVFAFILWGGLKLSQRHRLMLTSSLAVTLVLVGMAAYLSPQDPLRFQEGLHDIENAALHRNHDSSVGARIVLYRIGWEGFKSAPWLGVGSETRADYIHHPERYITGTTTADWSSAITVFQHVHNQYLHNAMEGGLVGLLGLLLVNASLFVIAWRVRKQHPALVWQLGGIAWVHAFAGLTNVNLLHNYYALMLGLAITVALMVAQTESAEQARQGTQPLH